MEYATFWVVALLASLFVGMGKGGLPMIGMMGVPILALVMSPIEAAGLLLPVYVVSDVIGLIAYRRDFDGRVLAIMVPGMLAGVGLAWATASVTPEWAVVLLVGLIGTVFALNAILRPRPDVAPRPARVAPGLFWGTVSGFTSFIIHSGGPPFQVYVLPLKLRKIVFAGTTTIAFAITNAAKLVPYVALGQLDMSSLRTSLVLVIPACLAVFGGVRLVKIIPEVFFFRFVTWALLALSLKLLWDGISGA